MPRILDGTYACRVNLKADSLACYRTRGMARIVSRQEAGGTNCLVLHDLFLMGFLASASGWSYDVIENEFLDR